MSAASTSKVASLIRYSGNPKRLSPRLLLRFKRCLLVPVCGMRMARFVAKLREHLCAGSAPYPAPEAT